MLKLSTFFFIALLCLQASALPAKTTAQALNASEQDNKIADGLIEWESISLVPLSEPDSNVNQAKASETAKAGSQALPQVIIKARIKSYKKVVVGRRRLSLSSRGSVTNTPPSDLIYKTVPVVTESAVDISPLVEKYAAKYNLDPWLVLGVIETESAFRAYAVSSSGAGGLMQLMPATALHLGCKDRFNPEENIAAGTRYLRILLDKFGSEELMLAAYNAGPGNVARYKGIPPFRETQNYVVKVKKAKARAKSKALR